MSPVIYSSPFPSFPVVERSIITHLFDNTLPHTQTAFIDATSGTVLSRGHFKSLVLSFAHGLLNHPRVGAQRGDTILIFSPNSLAWPVALYGSISAGLCCTLANSAYTPQELAHQYMDSGAKFIFTTEDGLPTVQRMLESVGVTRQIGEGHIILASRCLKWAGGPQAPRLEHKTALPMETLFDTGSLSEETAFDGRQAHATAFLCYSSGTTGKPKGVETTHQNLTSVIEAVKRTLICDGADDVILGVLPFYHIYGVVKLVFFPFSIGMPCVIQERFEPEQFCGNVAKYGISISFIVPPILVALARHPAVERYDMRRLRMLLSGAAPLGAALVQQVCDRLRAQGNTKLAIVQAYGLTETSPTTHLMAVADFQRKIGSVGQLLPNLQARLVADDDGHVDAVEGAQGEIWIRGPTVMKGYLNNSAATSRSITADGWLKTGDVAIIDKDGFYYIVDRRKELIKYKGFQVPPAELESVLLTHPEIADAAVIGVDDQAEATELPRAYLVHAHPEQLETEQQKAVFAQEVASWMQQRVAKHKFLRGGVVIIDAIPKSAAGKILRRELRERAQKERSVNYTKAKL